MKLLVTGGAGFIGTNFIRTVFDKKPGWEVVNLDLLTYAGNPRNLLDIESEHPDRYRFVQGDIKDSELLHNLFKTEKFEAVVHFAAESHVDRSIYGPGAFIETNIVGTYQLLEAARSYWESSSERPNFKFLHVSTDEVYGSLGPEGYFKETTPYDPSSPYSASKAGSDHLAKAYYRTYGFPAVITNCSNNYGPYQFPEKLIPLMILNIQEEKPLPVYGDGKNVRDWLFVRDHCDALLTVLTEGQNGETYNIGGGEEMRNIDVVNLLCSLLDAKLGRQGETSSSRLIHFVKDRPGHDRRYAIDSTKIRSELGWTPQHDFKTALAKTVDWYFENQDWVESIRTGEYLKWIDQNYDERA